MTALNQMDISSYLRRINYEGDLRPTAETLKQLHRAHLSAVPFENLDIHLGREIKLDQAALTKKIVEDNRGGFCYELNGLFAALLTALGFDVVMLSARVSSAAGVFGPEFDHLALQVSLDERWLADVGFGDSFVEPLLLDEPGEQVQPCGSFRIDRTGDALVLMQRESDEWNAQYQFTLQPRRLEDFSEMCRYHQTSPDSPFTRKRVCTLATEDGRVTLSEKRLIRTVRGLAPAEEKLETDEQYKAALERHFRVNLDRAQHR